MWDIVFHDVFWTNVLIFIQLVSTELDLQDSMWFSLNISAFSLMRFQSALLYCGTLHGGDLLNTGCISVSVTIMPSWSEKPGAIEQFRTSEGLFVRCSSKMLPKRVGLSFI